MKDSRKKKKERKLKFTYKKAPNIRKAYLWCSKNFSTNFIQNKIWTNQLMIETSNCLHKFYAHNNHRRTNRAALIKFKQVRPKATIFMQNKQATLKQYKIWTILA